MAVNSVVDRSVQSSTSTDLRRQVTIDRSRLPETLAATLGSPSRQAAIADRSYWHPNGFAKLVLEGDRGTAQLRLHVWPELPTTEDIHGHAWWYESVVLAGELTELRYAEVDEALDGDPMWRHEYGGLGQRRFSVIEPVPVNVAQLGPARVHPVGAESGGGPGHVHRFFPSLAPAATLLRLGPVLTRTSRMYRPTAEPPHLLTPRPTTRDEVRSLVGQVADLTAT